MNTLFNLLYWREAGWFALILLPVLLILFNRWQQKSQWLKLADSALHPWLKINQRSSKQRYSLVLLALAWLCFVIALAGPRLVDWLPPEQQAKPASLMVVLDLSASMNADDAYPSRKAQAIQWLQSALNSKPKALKLGLVLFAGHAFTLMPPTLDENVIKHYINQLSELSLPTLGNDLSAALNLAKQNLNANEGEQHIVILSDGDISKLEQQRTQATLNKTMSVFNIHFIGFGGNKAVKIPKQNGGFVLFNNRPVQSRLQTTWLNKMSTLNQVSYQHINQIKQLSLKESIQLSSARLNKQTQQQVIWTELFPYPLLLALIFFMGSIWRVNHKIIQPILLTFFALSMLSHSPTSQANSNDLLQAANAALSKQQFKQAQTLFKKMNNVNGAFGEGIACYRLADFQCATRAFGKVAWQAKTDDMKAKAIFNLGNSYFFLGNYAQAAVLFKDAELLGFDAKIAQKNLAFANTMQETILQQIKDIKEIFRRAKWRAATLGVPSPTLESFVSTQENLSLPTKNKTQNFILRQAINQQINQQLGIKKNGNNTSSQWIKSEQVANQSTAQLLKRLLEMELAIPAPLKEPQPITGKRTW